MTLKGKFKKQLDTATPTLNRPFYQAEQCEKIADEFAIGFLHWYLNNDDIKKFSYSYENLLKTYKKEKKL